MSAEAVSMDDWEGLPALLQSYRLLVDALLAHTTLHEGTHDAVEDFAAGEGVGGLLHGIAARAAGDGRPCRVLCFADFDPSGRQSGVRHGMMVRRLMPVECEKLQVFPTGYTNIPWKGGSAPDGARYRALGNAMAVPVVSWLLQRIEAVVGAGEEEEAA